MVYKLLEGSWEDDALLRDTERRVYSDPANIHDIDHIGEFYDVVGPHIEEVRSRAEAYGRDPADVLFFQGLSFIVGGTEEEARRKEREVDEYASDEGYRDGTMREKLFDGQIGPLLSPRHAGAAVRRERLGRTEVAA